MRIGKKLIDGFEDFVIEEALPEGYEDITSVSNFIKIGDYLFKDYKWIRKALQQQNWDSLSLEDKILIAQYKATSEENCKAVLGSTFEYWMTDFDMKSQRCREFRFSMAKTILIKNVSPADRYAVLGFLNTTHLESNYTKYGIEGTEDGDPIEGLFNFIEATDGGSYETTGIAARNFEMINGITKDQMVLAMMNCLRDGDY